MISPMIEVIGIIWGITNGGSRSRARDSRSATCWRLR